MKQILTVKPLLKLVYFLPVCALPFCSSPQPSPIEAMAHPIILKVKNDSVVEVEDKSGKKYVLNASDKFNYSCSLLQVGDTIELVAAK